ncbi:hypothetical protein DFH07DRAFT_399205 [Mycena maculata]|uniref:DUF6534 domain-containing protein n=1 Tax=Mycena maculata TaxID=230809 RepID=A0AAD7NI64_9AGAR|nr:hypothetical protein DFH07DRAFT_399205 [Mycena maculata]
MSSNPDLVGNGFLLAASWINCMLFTLEIILMIQYFQHKSRPRLHKIGVAVLCSFDVLCTLGVCASTYLTLLLFPSDSHTFPLATMRALASVLFTTYATASMEQLFLCYLYFALTKNRITAGFLVSSIAVHLGATYASAILVLKTGSPEGAAYLTSKIGAISCAATDVMIASALMYTFIRLGNDDGPVRTSTHSLLRRLMLMIFTSGVVVATTTLFTMIFLIRGSPAFCLFFYNQGRVYALTILTNFLVGIPNSQTIPTLSFPPTTATTSVAFRVDCQTADDRDPAAADYNRRSELVDMDTLSSPQKSKANTD